ncbi:MAG: MFS transporter [archaeon]
MKRLMNLSQIDKFGIVILLTSLGLACSGTIWSVFLESIVHNPSYVGFIFTFFSVVALLSYFFIIQIIERYSKSKLYLLALLGFTLSYLVISFFQNLFIVLIVGLVIHALTSLRISISGIITRDKSGDNVVSKNEGKIYTQLNLAWMIGPLIAGYIAAKYNYGTVFFIAAFFIFISMLLFNFVFNIKDNRRAKRIDKNSLKVFLEYFKDRGRVLCYFLSGGISLWLAFVYIYIPMFIIDSGYGADIVGYFIFAVAVPTVLLDYFFGRLACKVGFKKIFFIGYFIIGVMAIFAFFASNLFLILFLVVLASIGLSMLEPSTEAYFFDMISKTQRDKFYIPYNTTIEVNYLISTFIAAVFLLYFPFKGLFILFGGLMLVMAIISLNIKNIIESRHKAKS